MASARALESPIFTFNVGTGGAKRPFQVQSGVLAAISEPMKAMMAAAGMKESVDKVVELEEVEPEVCLTLDVSCGVADRLKVFDLFLEFAFARIYCIEAYEEVQSPTAETLSETSVD
jgi:hypothetical protein